MIHISKAFASYIVISIRQNAWHIVGTQEIVESIISIAVNFNES